MVKAHHHVRQPTRQSGPARTTRYLHAAIGPDRMAAWCRPMSPAFKHRRPTDYERLLLPFGFGERVEQIIGLFKAISVEGGFKVTNRMSLQSKRIPVRIIDVVMIAKS